MSECYLICREGNHFLVEENDSISWSPYAADATTYDTEEEAENRRLELGLVRCCLSCYSKKPNFWMKPPPPGIEPPSLPTREQRIIPGVIGHPTGGKVFDLFEELCVVADEYRKNNPNCLI